ncbi:MAG: T9SS type A sorting domain-containing protein [Bacteroidales bacterium]|nr:T9SS type A sorting domain-containing protein [Bacteroidales bacterium]
MKRSLLLCLIALSVVNLYSQISITRSDFVDVNDEIPRIFYTFEQEGTSIVPDSVISENLIYDDPRHFPVALIDTLIYFPSSDSDPEGIFEGATCAYMTRDGFIMHLFITEENVNLVGVQGELPLIGGLMNLEFVDTLIANNFPGEYEDTHVDQGTGMEKQHISAFESVIPSEYYSSLSAIYDTVRFFMELKLNTSFDEYGSIQFVGDSNQNGNFQYLRENRKMLTMFDVQLRNKFSGAFVSISGIPGVGDMLPMQLPIYDTSYTHNYWVKDWKSPLLEIEYNTGYDSIYSMTFRYAYMSYVNTNLISDISVYPNPASEKLVINSEMIQDHTLYIFGIDGKLVFTTKLNNGNNSVNLQEFSSGTYFYQLFDKRKIPVLAGKFIKE